MRTKQDAKAESAILNALVCVADALHYEKAFPDFRIAGRGEKSTGCSKLMKISRVPRMPRAPLSPLEST